MEKIAYVLLIIVAICYLIAMIFGMIKTFPLGLIGFVFIIAIGLLLIKAFRERLSDKEDEHYSKNVEK